MSKSVLKCPVHRISLKPSGLHVKMNRVTNTGVKPFEYDIFFCDSCQRYYFHPDGIDKEEKTKTDIKGFPLYYTKEKVCTFLEDSEKTNSQPRRITRTSSGAVARPGASSNTHSSGSAGVNRDFASNDIIMHVFKREEIPDNVKGSIEKLVNDYPDFGSYFSDCNTMLNRVFPSKLSQECIIKNQSYKQIGRDGNEFVVPKADIIPVGNSLFTSVLGKEKTILFSGKIKSGEFVLESMRLVENPIVKDSDVKGRFTFYHGANGKGHLNCLKHYTQEVATEKTQRSAEIDAWQSYLEWKYALAQLRVQGIKYIGMQIDASYSDMTFLVVTDGIEKFKEIEKSLRRNEISLFPNEYSTERYLFQLNKDDKNFINKESGIPLTYIKRGEQFGIDEVHEEDWTEYWNSNKHYRGEDGYVEFSEIIDEIRGSYEDPVFTELRFEFTSYGETIAARQLRQNGSFDDTFEETLAGEFYTDGFIATSQIGDFALIRRLQNAVQDFISGKIVSQGLDQWLFDISKARSTDIEEVEIADWQNPDINESQKDAVKKIVSVPDVCLIQGPPGTGKTTVIAEAIYQFVSMHKRVLVSSQANLAVDNALERLISNPKIRAIRLGNSRKIDDSVDNITEENVLKNFYESLVDYIDKEYLNKWNSAHTKIDTIQRDYDCASEFLDKIKTLQSTLIQKQTELESLPQSDEAKELLVKKESYIKNKDLMEDLCSFCNGEDVQVQIPKSRNFVKHVWNDVSNDVAELKANGIAICQGEVRLSDLDTIAGLSRGITTVQQIIANTSKIKALQNRLHDEQGVSTESNIDKLKDMEAELRTKARTSGNPSVYLEWKAIRNKIDNYGIGFKLLTSEEKQLFGLDKSRLSEEQLVSLIKAEIIDNQDKLDSIIASIIRYSMDLIDSFIEKIEEIEEKIGALNAQQLAIRAEIERISLEIELEEESLSELTSKYDASIENLLPSIDERISSLKASSNDRANMDDWYSIFTDFKTWVNDIPDYNQEKDVYLKSFINGCNVVGVSCTENARTLTEAGFDDFDVVIIDEVSKATPPELLIPMLRGRKIILVGDHRQLPPLFNEHEKTYQEVAEQATEEMNVELTMDDFNKYKDMVTSSLFQRYFENAGDSIKQTLTKQYRMHSDIMDLVNNFYDGQLEDGNSGKYDDGRKAHNLKIDSAYGTKMIIPNRHAYWFDSSELLGEPIYEQRSQGSTSAENIVEAQTILELLKKVEQQYRNTRDGLPPVSVGVISFYYDQVSLIRKMIQKESFHAINVEVNTVDRFQGKEKEIIFVSLVRNVRRSKHDMNSYIAAFQRINVAFSRAQNLLIIVGATNMYAEQPVMIPGMNDGKPHEVMAYKEIIELLNRRGAYFRCEDVIPQDIANDILSQFDGVIEIS